MLNPVLDSQRGLCVTTHFVITLTLCNTDTLCNNSLSYFVIKLLYRTLQYEICQKLQNCIVTFCNKIIICILLLTLKIKIDQISTFTRHGHHTWQTELSWGMTPSKVTWPCVHVTTWSHVTNKKRYISTSPRAMTAKLGKLEIYN